LINLIDLCYGYFDIEDVNNLLIALKFKFEVRKWRKM